MRRIDRFDKYREYKHLSDNKVSLAVGLSNGVIGKSRQANRDLSDMAIEKILQFYTDLNRDWLLYGEGEMLLKSSDIDDEEYRSSIEDNPVKKRLETFIKFRSLSDYGFEAVCGLEEGFVKDLDQRVSFESLAKIASAFPELNLGWLASGSGQMLIQLGQDGNNIAPMVRATNDVHHNQQVVIANWEDLREVLEDVIKKQLGKV